MNDYGYDYGFNALWLGVWLSYQDEVLIVGTAYLAGLDTSFITPAQTTELYSGPRQTSERSKFNMHHQHTGKG